MGTQRHLEFAKGQSQGNHRAITGQSQVNHRSITSRKGPNDRAEAEAEFKVSLKRLAPHASARLLAMREAIRMQ